MHLILLLAFNGFPEAVYDEGDDDESSPITFVRGVNLERLAIEAFIDLANPKLILRFHADSEFPTTSPLGSAKGMGKADDSQLGSLG